MNLHTHTVRGLIGVRSPTRLRQSQDLWEPVGANARSKYAHMWLVPPGSRTRQPLSVSRYPALLLVSTDPAPRKARKGGWQAGHLHVDRLAILEGARRHTREVERLQCPVPRQNRRCRHALPLGRVPLAEARGKILPLAVHPPPLTVKCCPTGMQR